VKCIVLGCFVAAAEYGIQQVAGVCAGAEYVYEGTGSK